MQPVPFPKPSRIWVDDGHVLIESLDGTVLKLDPEVAIYVGRTLEQAGTESFINKVMEVQNSPQ